MKTIKTKNRGAVSNPTGRFESAIREGFEDGWYWEEMENPIETQLFVENAKSIISHNDSPDIGFEQSINPYKGCEHGCIYCYARPSHSYMNLSAGLDFETKIFYKPDAAKLLEKELSRPKYVCKPIVLGANTDPYQPVETKLKITRSILEVLERFNHPFSIITKGALIMRDLDILKTMAERKLAKVAVSVTTLSDDLKRILEPRTAAPKARLRVIKELSAAGVPVRVMAAPIIPFINDSELEAILKAAKNAGVQNASYVLVRLPHEVKDLFKEWLETHFPDRAQKVMNVIRNMRGGKEYDATFGKRMRGEGEYAELLEQRFSIARKKFQLEEYYVPFDLTKFRNPNIPQQMDLFVE